MTTYRNFILVASTIIVLMSTLLSCSNDKPNTPILDNSDLMTNTRGAQSLKSNDFDRLENLDSTEDFEDDDNNDGTNETFFADGYSAESFGEAFDDPLEGVTKEELKQEPVGIWKTLLKLPMEVKYDERIDDIVFAPKFTPELRKLEGKEIEIPGYILPHDLTQLNPKDNGTMFIFSAFPAATCFFCGGAGPESVMEVYPKQAIPYQKTMVTLKGTLKFNETDYLKLAYKLENARLVLGK